VITTLASSGGWDLAKGVRTSGPLHYLSYLCCNLTHSHRVSRLRQLLHSISHWPAAVVGTWPKVFVPPVPSTTTPTYAVTSLTHSLTRMLELSQAGQIAE